MNKITEEKMKKICRSVNVDTYKEVFNAAIRDSKLFGAGFIKYSNKKLEYVPYNEYYRMDLNDRVNCYEVN